MKSRGIPAVLIGLISGMVLVMVSLLCVPVAGADWEPGQWHKMHYPQLPDPNGWDIDVVAGNIVADDWMCTESNLVTDIHFWYSWAHDQVGTIAFIHVSIHADIPDPDGPDGPLYSMPGEALWERTFYPGEFTTRWYGEGSQGFWDAGGGPIPNDHVSYYQCNITDIPAPFAQEMGNIYWLALSITVTDPVSTHIGWKTSPDHFNDDAVRFAGLNGVPWQELRDPYTGESLDMAFVITGAYSELWDFGDAPDPTYPTLWASNGARHMPSPFFMGALVDQEPDGQPNIGASGDDDNLMDDEDGVVFLTKLVPGQMASVQVMCSLNGILDAWIDFNGDGDWNDAGEQIFVALPVAAGPNVLPFFVPANTTLDRTYARFRFHSFPGGLAPTGPWVNGEVEDYPVSPVPGMATVVLIAVGCMSMGGFLWFRRKDSGIAGAR